MVLEIQSPVFKGADERKICISHLAEIPGYEGVIGNGAILRLIITDSSEELVGEELQNVCDVWNANFRAVETLDAVHRL